MKRCYAVQHGDTITVFSARLEEAIAYWQARPGSVLVYKAHGRWDGQAKRSTRWLPVPVPLKKYTNLALLASIIALRDSIEAAKGILPEVAREDGA